MKKMKQNDAITLIALVITIILLLILAGIALNFALGERGILNMAKEAKIETKKAEYKQELELIGTDLQPERVTNDWTVKEYMNQYETKIKQNPMFAEATTSQTKEGKTISIQVVTKEGYIYWINEEIEETDIYVSLNGDTLSFYTDEAIARENADNEKHFYGNLKGKSLTGNSIPWVQDGSRYKIRKVIIEDEVVPTSTAYYFYNLQSLQTIEHIENLNTSKVTNMENMFYHCSDLSELDVSKFDTSNVINFKGMFWWCTRLRNLNVSNFDTSKATDMSYMFAYCRYLANLDVSNFDTRNVIDMSYMFADLGKNCGDGNKLDLSKFDTSNVINMSEMLSGTSLESIDVSNFDTRNVTNMSGMFDGNSRITSLDISNFDTRKVTDMGRMFSYCPQLLKLDLSNFNTKNVTNMAMMFSDCVALSELNVSSFNTSNVFGSDNLSDQIGMYRMFYNCRSLTNLDLSTFDTSKITTMNGMFYNCSSLKTLNLSNFNTSNVVSSYIARYSMFDKVPTTVQITTNQAMKTWLNQYFSSLTNITVVE